MPTVAGAKHGWRGVVAMLDHALGRLARPLAGLIPKRLRRAAEKIERQRAKPTGQIAAAGFLAAAAVYGLIVGGQIGRLADSLLIAVGFGIENVRIEGNQETSELAILEQLDLGGLSLLSFDAKDARERLSRLPWVASATVRKSYPDTLTVEITEREPFALWQNDGEVFVVDRGGEKIVLLDEHRFAKMPFVVGPGANEQAAEFLASALAEPTFAGRLRAAVLVAGRRWDIHLENGLTVKLPEKGAAPALAQLARLDAEYKLLSRDVVVIDLRLPDRITVRLPEGRSLEEINRDPSKPGVAVARAPT